MAQYINGTANVDILLLPIIEKISDPNITDTEVSNTILNILDMFRDHLYFYVEGEYIAAYTLCIDARVIASCANNIFSLQEKKAVLSKLITQLKHDHLASSHANASRILSSIRLADRVINLLMSRETGYIDCINYIFEVAEILKKEVGELIAISDETVHSGSSCEAHITELHRQVRGEFPSQDELLEAVKIITVYLWVNFDVVHPLLT